MDELLTLRNYTNLLDPNEIDRANLLHRKDGVKMQPNKTEGEYAAIVEHDKHTQHCSLTIGSSREIKTYKCDCAAFKGGKTPEEPCVHLISLVIAINNGDMPSEGKPAAKSLTKKAATSKKEAKPIKVVEKKLPKDPAQRILHQMSSTEVFAFMEKALKENKDFKNYFLISTSNKNELSEADIIKMFEEARKSVTGRRQYINITETNKIVKLLKPLFEKAVEAESSGSFQQAFLISSLLFRQMRIYNEEMNTEPNPASKLAMSCVILLEQLASNSFVPNDLQDKLYHFLLTSAFENSARLWFKLELLKAAQVIATRRNALPALEKTLKKEIELIYKLVVKNVRSFFHQTMFTFYLEQLVEIVKLQYPNDKKKLEELYRNYMDLPIIYKMLVHFYLDEGETKKAQDHIIAMQNFFKKSPHVVNDDEIDLLHLFLDFNIVHQTKEEAKMVAFLAKQILANFATATLLLKKCKQTINNDEVWKRIIMKLSEATWTNDSKNHFAHLHYLRSVGLMVELSEKLIKISNPIFFSEFGQALMQWDVKKFMDIMRNHLVDSLTHYKSKEQQQDDYKMRDLYNKIMMCEGGTAFLKEVYDQHRNTIIFPPSKYFFY